MTFIQKTIRVLTLVSAVSIASTSIPTTSIAQTPKDASTTQDVSKWTQKQWNAAKAKWMKEKDGPAHLFRHLLDMRLGNFNPREHAPDTPGKRNMIMLGKNDAALWVQMLHDDPTQALKGLGPGIGATCDLYTPRQLFRAFDPDSRSYSSEASLGRALASAGFRQLNHSIGIKTAIGLCRLYPVRDIIAWEQATRTEVVEHFDKFWGPNSTEKRL